MKYFLIILVFVATLFGAILLKDQPLGSVAQSNDYFSTSTGGNLIPPPTAALVTGPGALGSVIITGANTGSINFYNATTTIPTQRAASKSTSSIWLGSIPASTAAGTYTFDVNFIDGLYVETSGAEPTSTITYRLY